MTLHRVFVDEAGDFNFHGSVGGSKYFILTSLSVPDDSTLGGELNDLRHRMSLVDDHLQDRVFHATVDYQSTRDEVFTLLLGHSFDVHATILDKQSLAPGDRTDLACYLSTWGRHLEQMPWPRAGTLITAATLFTGGKYRGLKGVRAAMLESVTTHVRSEVRELSIIPSHADPILQAADYCCWAIQRRYERDDFRSYEIIGDRISTETVWTV